MKLAILTPALLSIAAMSACSSSDGNSQNNFDGFVELGESLGVEQNNIQEVDVDDLPDNASMEGYLALGDAAGETETVYVGNARANADFREGTLVGSATNFSEFEVNEACSEGFEGCEGTEIQDISGTLDINGEITGTEFTLEIDGELTGDFNGEPSTAQIDLEGEGAFGTVDGDLVAVGIAEGTADISNGSGSEEIDAVGLLLLED